MLTADFKLFTQNNQAYSEASNLHYVVWQVEVNETAVDLYGRFVDGRTGLPTTLQPQLLAELSGTNRFPSVTWNSFTDRFAIVWVNNDQIPGNESTTSDDIAFLEIDITGVIIRTDRFITVISAQNITGQNITNFDDRNPSIGYDRLRNFYTLTFDFSFVNSTTQERSENDVSIILLYSFSAFFLNNSDSKTHLGTQLLLIPKNLLKFCSQTPRFPTRTLHL